MRTLLIAFATLLPSIAFADQIELPKLLRQVQPLIVTVIGYNSAQGSIRQGSGFFADKDGNVITNFHVVEDAEYAKIITHDGREFSVKKVVGESKNYDLIKLLPEGIPVPMSFLPVASALPEVGERVVVIGSPLGLEQTVSEGIVSSIRNIPKIGNVLQITAPISPGSSGSPVINMNGELVGIASFQFNKGQNLNFAISANLIEALPVSHRGFTKKSKSQEFRSSTTEHSYAEYKNERFQFSALYPKDLLVPQRPPANGDGREFRSQDGRIKMLVYGNELFQVKNLKTEYEMELNQADQVVTYKIIKDGWFVISGYKGDNIFYTKQIRAKESVVTLRIEYPRSMREMLYQVTTKIALSLRMR